jgi:energy-coupling factor transporter ATP-binding protein EcfA2
MNIRDCFAAPSAQYWLGTDNLDHVTFLRLLQGGRIALTVALTAVLIAGSIGLVLGMVAGFGPRWLDNGLLFFFDTLHAYPTIMVALTLAALNDRTDWKTVRRRMAMMFRDPSGSVSLRKKVCDLILEPFVIHGVRLADPARNAREMLAASGLNADFLDRYPHQLSCGQARRGDVSGPDHGDRPGRGDPDRAGASLYARAIGGQSRTLPQGAARAAGPEGRDPRP